jgi:hypothetical protein
MSSPVSKRSTITREISPCFKFCSACRTPYSHISDTPLAVTGRLPLYRCKICGFETNVPKERNICARKNPEHSISRVKKKHVVQSVLTPGELVSAGWPLPAHP